MTSNGRYQQEVRERAVRMVFVPAFRLNDSRGRPATPRNPWRFMSATRRRTQLRLMKPPSWAYRCDWTHSHPTPRSKIALIQVQLCANSRKIPLVSETLGIVSYMSLDAEMHVPLDHDFTAHNEEVQAIWAAYHAGSPLRVPVLLPIDAHFYLLNEKLNPDSRLTFEDHYRNPDVTAKSQLWMADYFNFFIAPHGDHLAGLPEKYVIQVETVRYVDTGYFGAPVLFPERQGPYTQPILAADKKGALLDRGLPSDPLLGWGDSYGEALQVHGALLECVRRNPTHRGRPVEVGPFYFDTDGPLTVATQLRGVELYTDFYTDPEYVRELLDLIVEATIMRIRAYRAFFGLPEKIERWLLYDDSIQMISTDMLQEFVLPAHRRLIDALAAGQINIHLCGDTARHFKILRDELGVRSFFTGFPIDFAQVREDLGPEVEILGGPCSTIVRDASPEWVREECTRILRSGVLEGGRFILTDASEIAPGTPLENLTALYETVRTVGRVTVGEALGSP